MRLHLEGVIETGTNLLDQGITDFEIAVIDGVTHLYASTGRNGGLSEYVIGGNGDITLSTSVIFPANIRGVVSDRIILNDGADGPEMLLGGRGSGLMAYGLRNDGDIGYLYNVSWSDARAAFDAGSDAFLQAIVMMDGSTWGIFPNGFDGDQVVDLECVTIGVRDFVVVANAQSDNVVAYRIDPATGDLVQVDSLGAGRGLGIDAPVAMETITLGGRTFVVLASANTSSVSVMELTATGQLEPVDHVVDTGALRIGGVQAMDVIEVGGQVFVVAGGADNGITLFSLLPDGTLVEVLTLGDDADTAMHNVSAIEMTVDGGTLYIFVASQNEAGITTFTLDLADLGRVLESGWAAETVSGTQRNDILMAKGQNDTLLGGAGDDILVSGGTGTQMTGGEGADIFVIRDGSGTTTIEDFQAGSDILNLSDLPMLRDVSQLDFTVTGTGAVISYRGVVIVLNSADGQPLSLSDVFPDGFAWGDHFPFTPIDDGNTSNPGIWRRGSNGADTIWGGARDDTLLGGGGNDQISGGQGDDHIDGGAGHDTLRGIDGENTLLGGLGNDFIAGGAGADSISGGDGNDSVFANDGDDTLYGGAGNDLLYGGAGNDFVSVTAGRNMIGLSTGNDTAQGGTGQDTIWCGTGDDVARGGEGHDKIGAGLGDDMIYGDAGNDTVYGAAGNDMISGGDGNDLLFASTGNDTVLGGAGNDNLWLGDGDDRADGGAGADQLRGGTGNDRLHAGGDNDIVWGQDGNDTMEGAGGDDWLSGGAGNDILNGGSGNDTLRGGSGYDVYWGGAGADVFEFFRDHDTGRVMDFDPAEGDLIRLDDWIWFSLGDLTPQQVVERFGSLDDQGNVVLDFSDVGGNVVILNGYDDLAGLSDHIEIF
ncbi:calcium-binding protein [Pararhodobacter marinus]|nr:calcium-binding protein [Pararhodobacter marinus]